MISLYSGTPGSGKSLHVASRIYHGLRYGRKTICNFEINLKYVHKRKYKKLPFIYIDNEELKPDKLIKISQEHFKGKKRIKEDDILLVVDECQLLFNSREWQKGNRKEWLSFFSQHRKYGYEIILVAQFDGMIDKQIRSLIEYDYKHRKASNFGMVGRIISMLTLGNLFCAVKMWYPLNERIGSEFFKAHKKYYRIYNTFGFFSDPDDKKEEESEGLSS